MPKNTGVGGLSLLQRIFPTQDPGIEPGSPAPQADSLPGELSHQGRGLGEGRGAAGVSGVKCGGSGAPLGQV